MAGVANQAIDVPVVLVGGADNDRFVDSANGNALLVGNLGR